MRENVFITKKQVLEMKQSTDERIKKLIAKALEIADEGLNTEVLSEDKVRYHGDENRYENQHEYYYKATNSFVKYMPCLGFAYYYTGEKKYFEKAHELMLMYAGYERWHGKGYHGRGELVTAEFCMGMTYGFEFFCECFRDEEIKYIAQKVYELGILPLAEDWIMPGKKIHALDTMGHNWWVWCVSAVGVTASVFSEYSGQVADIARLALKSIYEWIEYKGNDIDAKPVNIDNGGYYESTGYYMISKILAFENIYEKIFGAFQKPDYTQIYTLAAEFYLNTFYPSDNKHFSVPFGDVSNAFCEAVYEFIHAGIKAPELRWYVEKNERHRGKDVFYISELFYYDDLYGREVKKPKIKNMVYENIGWAIFRDTYDDNGNMLAVKCGDTWNHAHADAGNFVLYHNGEAMVFEDSKVSSYGADEYHGYIVTSKAHNVVLFNGEGQYHMDIHKHVRNKGKLYNFRDEDGFKYVCADYTGPMSRFFSRSLRHFLWLDDFVVIYDDITAYEPGELSFLLHADENSSFTMLSDCKCEKKVIYKNEDISDTTKNANDITNVECTIYSVRTNEENRGKFISVIGLDDKIKPDFEVLENGCRIKYANTSVYINYTSDGRIMHQNCINVFDGITTDAVMVVEKSGKFGVVNGSIVRKDSVSYHDTLYRTTGWINANH